MKRFLIIPSRWILLLLGLHGAWQAEGTHVDDHFLDAVAAVESDNGRLLRGDSGRALGVYQLWEVTWDEVNRHRAESGKPVLDYRCVWDPIISRQYAEEYLQLMEDRLARQLKRLPTPGELYAAYNLGFEGFARRDFRVDRCPTSTRRAIDRLKIGITRSRRMQLAIGG